MVSDLLNQMLGVAEKAAASGGGGGLGRARRGAARPGLRLPGVGGGAAEAEEDEEDEEDGKRELAALMQKLKASGLVLDGHLAGWLAAWLRWGIGLTLLVACRACRGCGAEPTSRPLCCAAQQLAAARRDLAAPPSRRTRAHRQRCCGPRSASSSACSAAASSTRVRGRPAAGPEMRRRARAALGVPLTTCAPCLPAPCCCHYPVVFRTPACAPAGYAMALSYLETLADLPWSRLSQAAGPPDGGPGGVPGGAPPPLPLGLVRHRLDEAHYGLDKVGAAVATKQG